MASDVFLCHQNDTIFLLRHLLTSSVCKHRIYKDPRLDIIFYRLCLKHKKISEANITSAHIKPENNNATALKKLMCNMLCK